MTDKEKKKLMRGDFKARERHALEASMPLSKSDLSALFDHLDALEAPCDHSLKNTVDFLKSRLLDSEKIIPWLREHGGYCDCEVLANVENTYLEILGRKLQEPSKVIAADAECRS